MELVATFIEKPLFVLEPEIRESEADALPSLLVRLDAIQGGGDDDINDIEVAMILFPLCVSLAVYLICYPLFLSYQGKAICDWLTGGGLIGFLLHLAIKNKNKKVLFQALFGAHGILKAPRSDPFLLKLFS